MSTFEKLDMIINLLFLGEEMPNMYINHSDLTKEWEDTRQTWLFALGDNYSIVDKDFKSYIKSLKREEILNLIGI